MDKPILSLCAVILTAIPVEYVAVRSHLSNLTEAVHKGSIYERGLFLTKECQWQVGIVQSGVGNAITAAEAERAIAYFQPQIILFVGVAGGLKDVRLGDIVVATKVYGYEYGKAGTNFKHRPEVARSTYAMEQRARAEARRQDWLQQIKGTQPAQLPVVHVGPIAAGEKVITSTRSVIAQFLNTYYEDSLAIEMEGYGFLRTAHANHPIEALIIRGISDLLNDKSKTDAANYQEVAARHASAFAFEILAKLRKEQHSHSQTAKNSAQTTGTFSISPITNNSMTIQHAGTIQAPVQVGNNNTINNFSPSKDMVEEGRSYLQRGKSALTYGNYTAARQYLVKAVQSLPDDQAPEYSSQAQYMLALAYLRDERPFSATLELWKRIEELLQTAIQFSPCSSYFYAFALFKRDFACNGWKKSQLLQDAQQLMQISAHIPHQAIDEENLYLLGLCQPLLMQEAQEKE